MFFKEITMDEYGEFARKHSYRTFLNSKEAFIVKQKAGNPCYFVAVFEKEEMVAATGMIVYPYCRFFKYAYAQRGFLLDYQNLPLLSFFVHELKQFLLRKKIIYLKIDPYVEYQKRDREGNVIGKENNNHLILTLSSLGFKHQGFTKGFFANAQCRFMSVLSLKEKDEETLWKDMSTKTRWSITKAFKNKVKVRVLEKEEFDLFKRIMEETAMRKHFVDLCAETYQSQIEVFTKENAKIYLSYLDSEEYLVSLKEQEDIQNKHLLKIKQHLEINPNSKKYNIQKRECIDLLKNLQSQKEALKTLRKQYGEEIPLSVAYFIFYEDEVVYLSSGSIPSLKNYHGAYAIQWEVIKEALDRNINVYNFYGTSGDFRKEAIDYGVFAFKRGFNAIPVELVGDFILPIRSILYRWLKKIESIRSSDSKMYKVD